MSDISSDIPNLGLGRLLREASQALRSAMRECLAHQSLTFSEWLHLRVLGFEDGLTAVEVAQRIGIEKASSTAALDALERQKLIRRVRNKTDRRKTNIYLAPAGSKYLEEMSPYVEAVHRAALKDVSPREMAIFAKVARKLVENLKDSDWPLGGAGNRQDLEAAPGGEDGPQAARRDRRRHRLEHSQAERIRPAGRKCAKTTG